MNFTFNKAERLKDIKLITALFEKKGESIFKPPILLAFIPSELSTRYPVQVMFSVSKKKFNKAHDRNRIKRLMKEAWRLHKHEVYENLKGSNKQYAVAFLYLEQTMPTFDLVEQKIIAAIHEFNQRLS